MARESMGTEKNALKPHPDIIVVIVDSRASRYRILQPSMSWSMSES